jgi:plastocyanin
LSVDDQSDIHNFHLTGEGVDVTTDVSGTGTETFDVDLTSGTYTFVCDPHASTMSGSFEVAG